MGSGRNEEKGEYYKKNHRGGSMRAAIRPNAIKGGTH